MWRPKKVAGAEEEKEAKAKEAENEAAPRKRVIDGRMTGLVTQWKGHMGWIKPLCKIAHEQASRHQGRIYLAQKDVVSVGGEPAVVKEGKVVDFFVYQDGDGLGAEECRQRAVVRTALSHQQARQALKDSPQWSEYLTDSEHYPAFEREHGALLRKYAWPLPFVLLEVWGHDEEIVKAVLALAKKGAEGDDAAKVQVRLMVSEDDAEKAKTLPGGAKVSDAPVFSRPLPCHEVSLEGTPEECGEVVRAVLKLTMGEA